jgi:hypothetical protein
MFSCRLPFYRFEVDFQSLLCTFSAILGVQEDIYCRHWKNRSSPSTQPLVSPTCESGRTAAFPRELLFLKSYCRPAHINAPVSSFALRVGRDRGEASLAAGERDFQRIRERREGGASHEGRLALGSVAMEKSGDERRSWGRKGAPLPSLCHFLTSNAPRVGEMEAGEGCRPSGNSASPSALSFPRDFFSFR